MLQAMEDDLISGVNLLTEQLDEGWSPRERVSALPVWHDLQDVPMYPGATEKFQLIPDLGLVGRGNVVEGDDEVFAP
jgi:hypothetical protein